MAKKIFLNLIFIHLFFLVPLSALSADKAAELSSLSLSELMNVKVTSSLFFDISWKKTPGHVFVINADDIENSANRTLEDIMMMKIPGILTGRGVRQGTGVGVRGLMIDNNAKTLVMLDGQNLNQRTHDGYMVGHISSLLGDIKSIEFMNGPGIIVHGSGAINGFINMLPKNGRDNKCIFANI